ncbi:MAG: trypsin-like peptidase domain-containing protein [Lachnospiraceae bacterium]|nr:trypsin-like peptidase domain-containing protein [Lachnospiraceae bacterium]
MDNEKKQTKKGGVGRFFKRVIALVLSAAVFGGVAGVVFNYVAYDKLHNEKSDNSLESVVKEVISDTGEISDITEYNSEDDEAGVIQTSSTIDNLGSGMDVSDIAENVMPSIVAINVKAIQEVNQGIFGSYQYEAEGSGSGIIIGENDTELLIVTNNHVVASAETVSVVFIDDETYDARVKSVDSSYDLAIVVVPLDELSADTRAAIKVANIGNSDELKVGEQVVAIGNALGYGQSVTTGIVSAKERATDTNELPLIQTDAAINPGNSGGALLNMSGELVGINSSKYASTDVEGMGYAIPISEVEDIIDNLVSKKTREKVDEEAQGRLGISCGTITSDIANMYDMPVGVLVSEVMSGSAAERAGIKKNDIITKFDGQSVSSAEELVGMLEYYRVGEKVEVTVKSLEGNEYVENTVIVSLGKNR